MPHAARRTRDSSRNTALLLLASASILTAALLLRRRFAPRSERRTARTMPPDAAPESSTTPAALASDTQHADSGSGALVHRRYEVDLHGVTLPPGRLMQLLQAHLTELAPSALADFEKSHGSPTQLRIGDEYDITMLGPWNGRVRVADVTADSLTLVTLDGHPEAGEITFGIREDAVPGTYHVVIESWARARDRVVHAAYNALGIGRQVQAEVWITFLQRLGTLAGLERTPAVRITTEELTVDDRPDQRRT